MLHAVCLVSVVPSTDLAGIVDMTLLSRDPNILWAEVVSRRRLDVEGAIFADHHAQAVTLQILLSCPQQCLALSHVLWGGQAACSVGVHHLEADSLSSTVDGGPGSHHNSLNACGENALKTNRTLIT